MSFDVFLQGFRAGEAADGDGDALVATLDALVRERDGSYWRIDAADPDARFDLYGMDDPSSGVMVSGPGGADVWQVVLEMARAAGFVIMPVGCPTLVTDAAVVADLPDGLQDDVRVVSSAADVRAAIEEE